MVFKNRKDAGIKLANELKQSNVIGNIKNAVVIGLPRGGVVVAKEISKALNIPLDIIICRKIGAPQNPEFAIGAVSEGKGVFLNNNLIKTLNINKCQINLIIDKELKRIKEYNQKFRIKTKLKQINLNNKSVIITDDGAATGSTIKAAVSSIKKQKPKKIIIALPVAPKDTIEQLKLIADKIIVLLSPSYFYAVSQFYSDFKQTSSDEVINILLNK